MKIKEWFLEKNLTTSQRQLMAEGDIEQVGETEKAVKILVTADNGHFTFWCPKSCLCSGKREQAGPEQMNGVRMQANEHVIVASPAEVGALKMMGFKPVK